MTVKNKNTVLYDAAQYFYNEGSWSFFNYGL